MDSEQIFNLQRGNSPLLLSMPHSGLRIPDTISDLLTPSALKLPDTDWFIPELYAFAYNENITVLKANFNRYVIDLNRSKNNTSLYRGKVTTGLCPETLFDGAAAYRNNYRVSNTVTKQRLSEYWQPYHSALMTEIERLKKIHGFCILYDAHSIRSRLPELFKGKLPDLNLGTNSGKSCDSQLQTLIESYFKENDHFTWTTNARFIGGYITRHYGSPIAKVHALQMEIAQCAYMNETTHSAFNKNQAAPMGKFLKNLIIILLEWHPSD